MTRLTVAENFRAIFYAPFYALRTLGYAREEGLDIEWRDGVSPGSAIESLKRGELDLTWGGPMRVMADRDRHGNGGDALVSFCQVVARDPFYLVGSADPSTFCLTDLPAHKLAVVSEVPTPWLCLQADIADTGTSLAAMRHAGGIVEGLTMPEQIDALSRGDIDVAQLFEPYVSQAIEEGAGHLLYAACARGPTVYTTFICTRDGLSRHRHAFAALTRAMQRVQLWMIAEPKAFLEICRPYFSELPLSVLQSALHRYCRDEVWASNTSISREGFRRLADSLHRGGFIQTPADEAACIADV